MGIGTRPYSRLKPRSLLMEARIHARLCRSSGGTCCMRMTARLLALTTFISTKKKLHSKINKTKNAVDTTGGVWLNSN